MTHDWYYILTAHYESGGHGLSLHSIAELCGRSPVTILDELMVTKVRRHVGIYICHEVDALLWGIGLGSSAQSAQSEGFLRLQRWLLNEYPWPSYKGIQRFEGSTFLTLMDTSNDDYDIDSPTELQNRARKQAAANGVKLTLPDLKLF